MCAIISWNGKITNRILRKLIHNAQQWGPHAAGVAFRNQQGTTTVVKRPVHPVRFLHICGNEIAHASRHEQGIAHVRHMTCGANTERNAHPFTYDKYCFAHNGIVTNWEEFAPAGAQVDSECFGPLIAQKNINPAWGSAGLVWMQQDEDGSNAYCYRRNQFLEAGVFESPVDGSPVTIVATNIQIAGGTGLIWKNARKIELEEGVAYRLKNDGLEPVWNDCHLEHTGHRPTRIWTGYHEDVEEWPEEGEGEANSGVVVAGPHGGPEGGPD